MQLLMSFSNGINLDENLTPYERKSTLNESPLKQYIQHCFKSRTYIFSIKKCGSSDCSTCLPISRDVFDTQYHLPDPVPDDAREGHCMSFNELYGNKTNENHLPSSKTNQQRGHGTPFSGIFIKCLECEKPTAVYLKNKLAPKKV